MNVRHIMPSVFGGRSLEVIHRGVHYQQTTSRVWLRECNCRQRVAIALTSPHENESVSMPPKKQAITTIRHICPTCDDDVEEAGSSSTGQDSTFCDGQCGSWLHRGCAGLYKKVFLMVSKSKEPF